MANCSSLRGARLCSASYALVLLFVSPLARATIAVVIHGIGGPLRTNVLAYLSFERYRHSKHLSADTIDRFENRVDEEVRSALEPFGYFQPTVQLLVRQTSPGSWRVVLHVEPGPAVILRRVDVRLVGAGAADPLFTRITSRVPFHPGERLDEAAYEQFKSALLHTAATYGYLDARLSRHELRVDPQARSASILLTLQTGMRYRFGATTIDQHAVRPGLVRRYLRYRQDRPFDLTRLLRTQFALDNSGYFSHLEVLPGTPDTVHHTVPVHIEADASRPNVYSVAAGYETDTGPRAILSWQDRRVNSSGHRMSVDLQVAKLVKYSLQSRYVIPIGDPATENLTLSASVEQRQIAAIDTRTMTIGPSLTRVTGRWQTVWFINAVHATGSVPGTLCEQPANVGTTSAVCPDLPYTRLAGVVASVGNSNMLVPGVDIASVPTGYFGEPIFQHGVFIELRGSHGTLGSGADFIQIHVELERVFRLAPKWHLLLRNEFGATAASHFDKIPPVMRFFTGGEGSVRGFEYNSLSPTQTFYAEQSSLPCRNGTIVGPGGGSGKTDYRCPFSAQAGGKDLITGTVEIDRDLPRNLAIAAFFDYGNAFDSFHQPRLLQYGAGLGLRVRLPVLTLGIDVGEPLSLRGHQLPRVYINFSPKL